MDEMLLFRVESNYIELAFSTTVGAFSDMHIPANEVSLVFVPLSDQLFEVVHPASAFG